MQDQFGLIVIGDEILSGRTRDANMHYLAGELTKHGIDLAEVRIVSDDRAAIMAAVNALADGYDHLFTSGGIGPTHDDITADAVAAAFGVPLRTLQDRVAAAHTRPLVAELAAVAFQCIDRFVGGEIALDLAVERRVQQFLVLARRAALRRRELGKLRVRNPDRLVDVESAIGNLCRINHADVRQGCRHGGPQLVRILQG